MKDQQTGIAIRFIRQFDKTEARPEITDFDLALCLVLDPNFAPDLAVRDRWILAYEMVTRGPLHV